MVNHSTYVAHTSASYYTTSSCALDTVQFGYTILITIVTDNEATSGVCVYCHNAQYWNLSAHYQ